MTASWFIEIVLNLKARDIRSGRCPTVARGCINTIDKHVFAGAQLVANLDGEAVDPGSCSRLARRRERRSANAKGSHEGAILGEFFGAGNCANR